MTAPGLDALIEELNDAAYRFGDSYPVDAARQRRAAAALVQLREENARLELWGKATFEAGFQERLRAERAEAELDAQNRALAQCRALLKQEMDDVLPLRVKVAALEAERDAAFALLRVCKDSVHPDTKIVIEALTT